MGDALNLDSAINVVWLKKDVRSHDHGPLSSALQKKRDFVILFVYEPDQLSHPSVHGSHVNFANEGLVDLERRLTKMTFNETDSRANGSENMMKQCITIAIGEVTEVLSSIHSIRPIKELLAHQETGHWVSFERDERVRRWCKANNILFHEYLQGAVFRCFKDRDKYDKRASHFFTSPIYPSIYNFQDALKSHLIRGILPPCSLRPARELEFVSRQHCHDRPSRQHGGESEAMRMLHTFLTIRGKNYAGGISSPNSSWNSCTRLSAHLTYGHISVRYVMKQINQRHGVIENNPNFPDRKKWLFSLSSMKSRLHWRSHFVQKLESEPELEHHAVCRAYDAVRTLPGDYNPDYFKAWAEGKTGFPLVDACMRCLLQHGWINFRMRAMLVSFATYNLWLDWRIIEAHLARCFLDFEPGIHFPQLQMQAGVTGINAMRVYNVTKQAKDQDKDGYFIRKYVPELVDVPTKYIFEPAKMPKELQLSIRLTIMSNSHEICEQNDPRMGQGEKFYPSPIVNETESVAKSKAIIADIKRTIETRKQANAVYLKHGSRRRTLDDGLKEREASMKKRKPTKDSNQPTLAQLLHENRPCIKKKVEDSTKDEYINDHEGNIAVEPKTSASKRVEPRGLITSKMPTAKKVESTLNVLSQTSSLKFFTPKMTETKKMEHNKIAAFESTVQKVKEQVPVRAIKTTGSEKNGLRFFFPINSTALESSAWLCKFCTFKNEKPLAPVCEVCGSERHQSKKR